MGWTSLPYHGSVKQYFLEQYQWPNSPYEVLDVALVHRKHLYGAVKNKETGDVICAAWIVGWAPKAHHNFYYKDMDETVGPYIYDVPDRIFNLLTEPINDWSKEWREKVQMRKNIIATMKQADVISTTRPVRMTSGFEYKNFKKIGRKMYAVRVDKDGTVTPITRVQMSYRSLLPYII